MLRCVQYCISSVLLTQVLCSHITARVRVSRALSSAMSRSPSPLPPRSRHSRTRSRSRSRSRSPARSPSPSPGLPPTIDRQTTTPFLLNFCYRSSAFHNLADFPVPTPNNPRPALPAHLQIYTWMSCTLKELAMLLTSAAGMLPGVFPENMVGCRLGFRLVYPDMSVGRGRLDEGGKGRYISREMGSVVIGAPPKEDLNGDKEGATVGYELGGEDAEKTLEDVRFVIGDYVDCAVFPPLSDGSVVGRGAIGGFGGRGRENGFAPRGARGGGYGMAGGRGRGDFAANIPSGEWRRGERLPDGYRGAYGGGRGRGRY